MIAYVLGAPGSGKTSVASHLRQREVNRLILDWDGLQEAAGELAGTHIPTSVRTWEPYGRLMRAVVDQVGAVDTILFGVCTPDELAGWPIERWLLLDCDDDERRRRLERRDDGGVEEALLDAAAYRQLGLPSLDTTGRSIPEVGDAILALLEKG